MTRVTPDFGEGTQKDAVLLVSSDVNFVLDKFPDYKIGSNSIIIEPEGDPKLPSLKEIVAKETALLLDQQKRLSVRDLAKKFENGLAAAAELSDEVLTQNLIYVAWCCISFAYASYNVEDDQMDWIETEICFD